MYPSYINVFPYYAKYEKPLKNQPYELAKKRGT